MDRPRRCFFGSWASASRVVRCGRSRCCCPRSREWWPKVFFHVAVASCFSECARTRTPSRSTITCPVASGAARPANFQTRSRTSARAESIAVKPSAWPRPRHRSAERRSDQRPPDRTRRARLAASPRPRGQSPPSATARATPSRILPGSCIARRRRHGANAADIADPARTYRSSRPAAQHRPARPPHDRRPRRGHADRTRYASSPGECFFHATTWTLDKSHRCRSGALSTFMITHRTPRHAEARG